MNPASFFPLSVVNSVHMMMLDDALQKLYNVYTLHMCVKQCVWSL